GGVAGVAFVEVGTDPQAIQKWFASLLVGGPPPIQAWLSHFVGLLGSTTAVTGGGTPSDPWTATIFTLNASSTFNVTLAQLNGALQFGALVKVAPGGATPVARIEAQAVIASLPLAGTGSAAVLPSASVVMRSPGTDGGAGLVSSAPTIAVDHLRAGFVWNGTNLA